MRVDREIREKFSDESNASFEARKLWYDFRDAVFFDNRFFVKHPLLDILAEYMSRNEHLIEVG